MNHLNCFVLEAIAKGLEKKVKGSKLVDCFSNSIDEFSLQFEDYAIRCTFFEGSVFFHFDNEGLGKNRLFKPQFQEIKSLRVVEVMIHPFERSFHLEIENGYKLVFKCHGRKSNIILFENNENLDVFRKHLEKDQELRMEDIFRKVNPVFQKENFADRYTFEKAYPYLPVELFDIMQPASPEKFQESIKQFRTFTGISFNEEELEISPKYGQVAILEDISAYSAAWLRRFVFENTRQQLLSRYENAVKEKRNFISSNRKALDELLSKRSDEELGNIILSNMHLIKEGDSLLKLNDIYNDGIIEVKFDKNLNAVENAEKYFKKEKKKPLMIQLLKQKIEKAEQDLATNEQKLTDLKKAMNLKSIKHLVVGQQKKQEEIDLPYRLFQFEDYQILVGKHAESNERILNYYSEKDDIWLHAKDVGGSHVLVKMNKQAKIPANVLEKAASLAAYYSKNRNQDLVTVTYTQRKYVRKVKGADKGKVTVSNEKSILVKPGK
jgi:predicted ribosome quality control (RQC) complex YloA/Tae2 family protein